MLMVIKVLGILCVGKYRWNYLYLYDPGLFVRKLGRGPILSSWEIDARWLFILGNWCTTIAHFGKTNFVEICGTSVYIFLVISIFNTDLISIALYFFRFPQFCLVHKFHMSMSVSLASLIIAFLFFHYVRQICNNTLCYATFVNQK
jgi:hypothetical protein